MYHTWQLPTNYFGPHAHLGRGRVSHHRHLADMQYKGAGNDIRERMCGGNEEGVGETRSRVRGTPRNRFPQLPFYSQAKPTWPGGWAYGSNGRGGDRW